MLEHVFSLVAHEAAHRLMNAWKGLTGRNSARDILQKAWWLMELTRTEYMGAPQRNPKTVIAEFAELLAYIREPNLRYAELLKSHTADFTEAMQVVAKWDYEFRKQSFLKVMYPDVKVTLKLQLATMELRRAFEKLNIDELNSDAAHAWIEEFSQKN